MEECIDEESYRSGLTGGCRFFRTRYYNINQALIMKK